MEQQLKLIESAGLQVKDFYDVPIASLMRDRLSPKLIQGRDIEASVIDTYIIRKP